MAALLLDFREEPTKPRNSHNYIQLLCKRVFQLWSFPGAFGRIADGVPNGKARRVSAELLLPPRNLRASPAEERLEPSLLYN